MQEKEKDKDKEKEETKKAPIIIKKVFAAHHGHHGGAWKVAYADFVTAMMAFFLLMWLLNAVPTEKLKGIAEYFDPTIGISGQLGEGFKGGFSSAAQKEGLKDEDKTQGFKYGVKSVGDIVTVKKIGTEASLEEQENQRYELVEGELNKLIEKDKSLQDYKNSLQLVITPEGLEIRIFGQDKHPMFKPGSAELTAFTEVILFKIAKLIQFTPNFLQLSGFTDRTVNDTNGVYTNWELSADRANAARRYLVQSGVPSEQIGRVIGKADTDPADPNNPYAEKNRRITITLLRNSIMPYNKISAPKDLIGTPSRNDFDESARVR
ncbi:OmpA family protein [Holosporaceae bacterium 'Namur']|nr:OmpA family protein [Holosporaceae bacterium 'Namur']